MILQAPPSSLGQAFMSGLGQFTGIFFGVIAGTAITILTNRWMKSGEEKTQISNLKFELDLNRRKTNEWLTEMKRYRDSVNGDAIQNYFGYFKFSSAIGVTSLQMHQSGLLYKLLTHDEIGALQEMFNDYSQNAEQYFNGLINQHKQNFTNTKEQLGFWQNEIKPKVVSEIDFWEQKLHEHGKRLTQIIDKLTVA